MLFLIPTFLSLSRIIILPLFYIAVKKIAFSGHGQNLYLLLVFIAGLSDFLDGFLARFLKVETDYGIILDPLADKIFTITAFLILSYFNFIPKWVAALIVFRDLFLILGTGFFWFKGLSLDSFAPVMLSKINTSLEFLLILIAVFGLNIHWPLICLILMTSYYSLAIYVVRILR